MNQRRGHEIPPEVLDRFATGAATAEERAGVIRHLLARCTSCRAHLRRAAWPSEAAVSPTAVLQVASPLPGAYDRAFALAEQSILAVVARRQPVRKLLTDLERLPAEQQLMRVRNVRRYASPDIVSALVARSHEVRYVDGRAMLRYARLAVASAEATLCLPSLDPRAVADCRARAWGQLGTAQRVNSALLEAERSLSAATAFLSEGSGDRELRAWLLLRLAAFHSSQRRFSDMVELLREATAIYRELGDRTGEASALISQALGQIYSGNPELALPDLLQALDLLQGGDTDLILSATFNLVLCYLDLGRPLEAYDMLAAGERQLEGSPDDLANLRWKALRGMVDRDLGLFGAAEMRLVAARDGFLERDMAFQVALVSLQLADLYARQRKVVGVVRMVADALPILQGLGATRDVLAAVMKLREIAHEQQAAIALVRQIVTQLRPGLPKATS